MREKHVVLILEYDLGDFSDMEVEGIKIPIRPEDYQELFDQSDILSDEMRIVGVDIRKVEVQDDDKD